MAKHAKTRGEHPFLTDVVIYGLNIPERGLEMAWTESLVKILPTSKTVVSPDGVPYVSLAIAPKEYVEVHLVIDNSTCPYKISFKRFDELGGLLEEREYAQAGTIPLAKDFAIGIANFRLNSYQFVLDGE